MHPVVVEVTERLIERSRPTREAYLAMVRGAASAGPARNGAQCANFAHGVAGCGAQDKQRLRLPDAANIAIVTAYNDMLSAHQPYEDYPERLRQALRDIGSVGQVAGGVPAMCDGVTQGEPGMELAIASREVIAMSTAVALSHNLFDGALLLGICDKIVPGLLIGALRFGHLPAVFVPAGPMPSGLANKDKAAVRQRYAEGKAGRDELLAAEMQAYHSPGTCTFYGTANTNQMLMEFMGLHLPGASFVNPGTPLREALTVAGAQRALAITAAGNDWRPAGHILDEKAFVNGIVGLMATGGSTNLVLHLPAMARAAGVVLELDDFAEISDATPLMAKVYPNGLADVNHFHAAGGLGFMIGELLDAGLLHPDTRTVAGDGLARYTQEPRLIDGALEWHDGAGQSANDRILRPAADPFQPVGGLKQLAGNLGRGVIKVSAVAPERRVIEAPARIFHDQEAVKAAFRAGEFTSDVVVVVRFQGPRANGMPELHALTPTLSVLLDRGLKVALVTDGRMSGASGKVPAAIHVSPEAAEGGPLARLRDGDVVRVDAVAGTLGTTADLAARAPVEADLSANAHGLGRDLFAAFRAGVGPSTAGAALVV